MFLHKILQYGCNGYSSATRYFAGVRTRDSSQKLRTYTWCHLRIARLPDCLGALFGREVCRSSTIAPIAIKNLPLSPRLTARFSTRTHSSSTASSLVLREQETEICEVERQDSFVGGFVLHLLWRAGARVINSPHF